MRTSSQKAFTLIEVMVSVVILGIIAGFVMDIFRNSSKATSLIAAQAEILNESQIAMQVLSSRLREAVYIFPAGQTFQFFSSGVTAKNTIRNTMKWVMPAYQGQTAIVDSDPYFISLILPPKDPTLTCVLPSSTDGCYRFFAYYPMIREKYINSTLTAAQKPDPDSANDNKWIMMEYRKYIMLSPEPSGNISPNIDPLVTSSPSGIYGGGDANFLLDYLDPRVGGVGGYETLVFQVSTTDHSVKYQFRTAITTGTSTLKQPTANAGETLPAAGKFFTVEVYPRNM